VFSVVGHADGQGVAKNRRGLIDIRAHIECRVDKHAEKSLSPTSRRAEGLDVFGNLMGLTAYSKPAETHHDRIMNPTAAGVLECVCSPCSLPSVAANAPAVEIYELPHVAHERLLLLWR
jgi:hypothetical protein